MKKKIIVAVILLLLVVLLFPIKTYLKDGGTIQYTAILYRISKVHRLALPDKVDQEGKVKEYDDGITVELLGFEIFNNVK